MIYKNFKDLKLSWLGMGCMRLPAADGAIDEIKATELIEHGYASGINYFDTAYFYHGGKSESFIGKTLARFPRESWYLANKMPGNMMRYVDGQLEVGGFNMESFKISGASDVFEYQLNKCGVDYFDFYLLHNVAETTYGIYTDEKLAIVDYLISQKKAGHIRHFGFSSHGRPETIEAFLKHLEMRGQLAEMEFCMIQLNYLDWALQEAGKKYKILTDYGLPVFVMEPVRGGRLTNLKDAAADMIKVARPDISQAAWAFRYLQSFENIPMILSGMTTMEQLKENLALFDNHELMTAADKDVLAKAVETMAELAPCTACRYCLDACPKGLDIPKLLSMYNEAGFEVAWTLRAALRAMDEDKLPASCLLCGKCNPLCPQNINIPQSLMRFNELLA